MTRFLLRRLLFGLPTLLGITLLTFALSRLAPGGPLSDLLDPEQGRAVTKEQLAATEKLLGFDRPLHEQYGAWLSSALRFDFGRSLTSDRLPVAEKIAAAAAVSLELQGAAVVLLYGLGIPLGVFAAARAGTRRERCLAALLFVLQAMPTVVIGALLLIAFARGPFAWLPLAGLETPGAEPAAPLARALDHARHLVLPVACLVLSGISGIALYARAGVLEALRQPWIRAARARGLPEWRVRYVHALKSGILPLVALLGGLLPWLVGGSVAVETLFSLPGLGRLTIDSIAARDYPTVMALTLLVAAATWLGFLLADLLHAALRRGEVDA